MSCPRSHADLRNRNVDIALEDLPDSLRLTYEDAITRGCGCAPAKKYVRIKESEVTE